MLKHHYKTIMLLPLMALLLSGCYEIIPEDAPEEIEDEFTPEGSYIVPEEDTSESSSIPYESTGDTESTGGDNTSSPSETPGGNTSSPSETPGGDSSSESGSSSSSSPSETHNYHYTLEITNKEQLEEGIVNSYDNPNTYNYSLEVELNIYDEDLYTECKPLTSEDVSASSSNPSIIDIVGLDLVLGTQSGEVTLSVSWKEDSSVSDSVTLFYSYTEHQLDLNYTYDLEITNKDELGSTWLTSEAPKTVELKLTKYTYDGTTLIDTDDSISAEGKVELSAQNIVSDYDNVITIDGFDVSGAHPGSLILTATWIETSATDSVELIIEEDYIDGNYSISVNSEAITSSEWRYGEAGRTLSGTLSYTTTAYSDSEKVETHTIDITSDNVNIEIKDGEGNASSVLTNDGLTLIPIGYGTATVYISWISEGEILATTSFEVTILEPIAEVYKLEILNKTDLQQTWYLGDEARELKISITPDSETAEEQDVASLINSGEIQVNVSPSDALDVSISGGGIYLSPLKAYESITVSVSWTSHEEAFSSVTLALGEHTYSISITNSDDLSSPWSIEEGVRTLGYNLYLDGSLLEVETGYVLLKSSNDTLASVDGFNIYPQADGEPIIYILWYEDSEKTTLLAYDLVTLNIDSVVKPVSISLSTNTIAFTNAYTDSEQLTAIVYGNNDQEATNQNVTWSADTGILISGEGNTITISVSSYNVSGKVTCTSQADGNVKAECTVSIGDEPSAPAPNVETDTKYKLGCIDANGTYVFFDGNVASSHLESTKYWSDAADVFITANPYDGIENSCTLAIFNGSIIQYITNTGSSANVTLSTSPCVWVWNEENNIFAVGSSTGYGLFCYTDDSFRGYTQSSNLDNYPHIVAYSEQPQDYTEPEKIEIPEPNTEIDPTYKIGGSVSGTYKYFNGSISSSSMQLTTDWDSAADVYITGATGDNPDGACTLSILDSSSTLKYIQNSGDSAISLDSDPSIWYWEEEYQAFVQSTTSGRYIGFATDGNSIKAYAHSNITGTTYPVAHAYSDNPLEAIPTSIEVTGQTEVMAGSTIQLSATIYPEGAQGEIKWSSSDISNATVDQNGLVTGVTANTTARITAEIEEYSVSGYLDISVIEANDSLIGIYDFGQSGNTYSDSSAASDANLKTMVNNSWSGSISDPLSSLSASNCFRGAGGTSDSYPVQEEKGAIKLSSSSKKGTMTLTFNGGTNIKSVVIVACGYDGNSSSYTLSVNSSAQQMGQSAKNTSLTSVSQINSYVWNFDSATNSLLLEGNINTQGTTAYRVLVFSIALYSTDVTLS